MGTQIDPQLVLMTVQGAAGLIVKLASLLDSLKAKPKEVNDLIILLQNSILDVQTGWLQAQGQIAALTTDISNLKRQLADLQDLKDNYEFRDNMCWRKGSGEGPFCPTCLQGDHKAVNLIDCFGHYECRTHKQNYLTAAQQKEATKSLKRGFPAT
jgi:hypothetical protein